ncbi:lipid A deacylase LpxR family protein [Larsenimonas rhizosphaerae]|uniref:Lipid A deacylase LpxR family protein n=1 Tax=Larsenimonas rhizosphaerae TaxID=2944682 RepID=A0AA41ZM27_9GAMM|nr:lipid A deacylase LpxR family protein [Larsenimonas rhizosphaerae]MCX2524666.1 lipid A deacylase LpxR family protein [Larsenimonas rhizosphaerae]
MRLPALALALTAFSPAALASGTVSLKLDNDIFTGDGDGHYTNGLEAQWTFSPGKDHWTRDLSSALPLWSRGTLAAVSYHLGQQIYTPENTDAHDPVKDDRPYAGYLYGGVSLFQDAQQHKLRIADTLYIEAGIVGPAAGGKTVQNNFHHLIDSDRANGWHNQLHNEPTLTVGWNRAWWVQDTLGSLALEYGPNAGFALGNLHDYAETGMMVRIGKHLNDFHGIPAVAPGRSTRTLFTPSRANGWYVFTGITGRYMAHNLLLDGNTFENSPEVDRRPWVGDLVAGVAFSVSRWNLAFTSVWRTHEFEQQHRSDRFGSVILSTSL